MSVTADSVTMLAFDAGIYTIQDAARLLQVTPRKLQGWAEGYSYRKHGETRGPGPVIERSDAEPGLLTFRDLIELAFVREFREAGVPLPTIRDDASALRDEWGTAYPFASRRIAEFGKRWVDPDLMLTIRGKQQVFEFGREFFRSVDFDDKGLARLWYPLGRDRLVLVDPTRSFGAPIEQRSGIRTEILYRQFKAEGGVQAVADWYEVSPEGVEQAVEFEERWRKKAA